MNSELDAGAIDPAPITATGDPPVSPEGGSTDTDDSPQPGDGASGEAGSGSMGSAGETSSSPNGQSGSTNAGGPSGASGDTSNGGASSNGGAGGLSSSAGTTNGGGAGDGGSAGASTDGGAAGTGNAGSSGASSGGGAGTGNAGSAGSSGAAGNAGSAGASSGGAAGAGNAGAGGASGGAGMGTGGGGTPNGGAGGLGTGGGAGAASAGAGGSTGGAGGSGLIPDLADGYWLLDATDADGGIWVDSIFTLTSTTSNVDGTVLFDARIDWFQTAPGFGVLLCGEEFDSGSFDPATGQLIFDQTGGWEADTLDHYEASYDPGSDRLLNGFWSTGPGGTFTATRVARGRLLPPPTAQTSSQASAQLGAATLVDADQTTFWGTSNGKTVGEVITLTLAAPSPLRAMRFHIWDNGNQYATPARVTITSRDGGGTVVDTSDRTVPTGDIWQAVDLDVGVPVAEVQIEITEVAPASANRLSLNGVELFGAP